MGAAFSAMGAGTRAGKGAGIVITNLMKYWWSVIILDPKRECLISPVLSEGDFRS